MRLVIVIAMLWGLVSCAPLNKVDEIHAINGDWLHKVVQYRKALNEKPNSVERKVKLKQAELAAVQYYYKQGMSLYTRDRFDLALTEFQKGLTVMPENEKLSQMLAITVARQEANFAFEEAENLRKAGKLRDAEALYRKALTKFSGHKKSVKRLAEIKGSLNDRKTLGNWAMDSDKTITLRFRETGLRTAFEFIARSFKVNVIFDEGTKDIPVTMFARDVTFKRAISLLTATSKTFFKRIGSNTIIIASDKKEKRGQYEDHITKIFPLKSIAAKKMREIIKNILSVQKLAINENLNTLIVRDTAEVLSLVSKIVNNNDRKPAEMILDVEILEVSRSKADKLGLDLGTYEVSAGVSSATRIPLTGSIATSIEEAANLTIPSVTLRFLKQEVDAKTLANPRIRVINHETAKIHIGDRVPLQASRIIDATGQVRTTFEYRDIGIRLKVTPTINLDHSVAINLDLEVSSLGENLGTPNEPAFKIGTRNASSIMILRDGETAILGGLIRNEDRTTETKVPGLGSIPLIGRLFTSSDKSRVNTDILLTISPRIIRGHDLAPLGNQEFYSGTAKKYLDRPVFAYGKKDLGASSDEAIFIPDAYIENDSGAVSLPKVAQLLGSKLGFSDEAYSVKGKETLNIKLVGSKLTLSKPLVMDIIYDSKSLVYVEGDAEQVELDIDSTKLGVLHLQITSLNQINGALANLVFRGIKPGKTQLRYHLVGEYDGLDKEGLVEVELQ